jgi:1,4-dihydroxy-2-naphthoate octaprenyltransferase
MSIFASPRIAAWISASRPRVFTAALVPMGIAACAAIENEIFRPVPFFLALIGVMLLQTAANLVNEYADYRRGADTYKVAGQGMTIKNRVLSPNEVLLGAVATIIAGSLIGLYLLSQSGPLLWWIGISAVLVAITYTAGPFPLAYNGLGELAAGIWMGPLIVVGAYYVMDTNISWDLVWVSLPIIFTVAAILHANNLRDLEADRAVNKRTLAVILGRDGARTEFTLLMLAAYVSLVVLVIVGLMPPTALFGMATIPIAYDLVRIFNTTTDAGALHIAQGRTAKLHGQFGLLIVIGWLLWLATHPVA